MNAAATLARYNRLKPQIALLIGPGGSGKSTLARHLAATIVDSGEAEVGRLDTLGVTDSLPVPIVIVVRADPPTPALVLVGEHGPEPVYDTDALLAATHGAVPKALLLKVDAVLVLPTPDAAALTGLASIMLEARGIVLPAKTVEQLVALALKSGRSAHELAALVARIPAGQYQAP